MTRVKTAVQMVTAGLVAVALAVGVAILGMAVTDQPSEDFPAWLSAIGSAVALFAAVAAAILAARAFQREADRDDRALAAQRSAQAQLVAAWEVDILLDRENIYLDGTKHPLLSGMRLALRNASQVPVTNVRVAASLEIEWLDPHNPAAGHTKFIELPEQRWAALPPATDPLLTVIEHQHLLDLVTEFDVDHESLEVRSYTQISFIDAAGVRWLRGSDGFLSSEFDS